MVNGAMVDTFVGVNLNFDLSGCRQSGLQIHKSTLESFKVKVSNSFLSLVRVCKAGSEL